MQKGHPKNNLAKLSDFKIPLFLCKDNSTAALKAG